MLLIINFFICLIELYRNIFSFFLLPSSCRFYPTCSIYAQMALFRFGLFKGIILIFLRLLRCHSLNIGGKDFLPLSFNIYNILKK
ncbi:membrane protein insertion efficiency factor YidD [Candidatus Purcelliella pentastirinorum]|nr:membrane protein insertion efficiency factor YidD [Candidatus Purcelliella pentastirinorum]WDI79090.1 membrane protein insertion efficiency factor YidD [Candidatus Purcelliella pentastirinorum]WDR80229.1 membrane protein insertion efficiency factor YidD [Candidatus Purcelliella pentastirinorum]